MRRSSVHRAAGSCSGSVVVASGVFVVLWFGSGCGRGSSRDTDLNPDLGTTADLDLVSDAATTPEDQSVAIDVRSNDSSQSGSEITISAVSAPAHGTAEILPDGSVIYRPELDFHGEDLFEYTGRNQDGETAVESVRVTITPVNDPPRARDDDASTTEETPVVVDVLADDFDVDGDPIRVVRVTQPANGSARRVSDSEIEYTPASDFEGEDSVEYFIVDDSNAEAVGVLRVTISGSDDPPIARDDDLSALEDTPIVLDVLANDEDPEGGPLTLVAVAAAQSGSTAIVGGSTVRYTPARDFFGTDSFEYTVSDRNGAEASATARITVEAVNDPPTLTIDVLLAQGTISRGGNVEVEFTPSDPDDPVKVDVLADIDGDGSTAGDQTILIEDFEGPNAVPQRRLVRTLGIPRSSFRIAGRADDGVHPSVFALAPPLVETSNLAFALRAGSARGENGSALAVLSDESILVAGSLRGTVRFSDSVILRDAEDTSSDIWIAKFDSNGAIAWALRAGGPLDDSARALAAFPDGSFVVTGHFAGEAIFEGRGNRVTLRSEGDSRDCFVARYDREGGLEWALRGGGSDEDEGSGIASFANGACVVTGYFRRDATFGSSDGDRIVRSRGNSDVFLARYSMEGNVTRLVTAGGTDSEEPCGVASDADGSAVVTGWYWSDVARFGDDEDAVDLDRASERQDAFVARFRDDLSLEWVRGIGNDARVPGELSKGNAAAVFPNGDVVITGSFAGSAAFSVNAPFSEQIRIDSDASLNIWVARYRRDGRVLWVREAGGPSNGDEGTAVAVASDDSIFVTGSHRGAAVFGSGEPVETTLPFGDRLDVFFARYDDAGRLVWARSAPSTGDGTGAGIGAYGDGSAAFAGSFSGRIVFGSGDDRETALEAGQGTLDEGDIFIARVNADGGF
jgi:hypothetical protein